MNKEKKIVEEAECCNECMYLKNDNGTLRCLMFDNVIIDDEIEKQCSDSIYG